MLNALQKRHSEQEAAELMRCLMEVIAFMHSKGLTHRDLKPENIMLSSPDKEAVIKIIDFGTSDFCPEGHRLFHKFGTPLYVAPEVSCCLLLTTSGFVEDDTICKLVHSVIS